jgi:HK97 gp10 family phage protein
MGVPFSYNLSGFNEMVKTLLELKEDVGKKAIYMASSAAARVVRNNARKNAQAAFTDPDVLVKNIVVGRSKEFTPPVVAYEVGVRHGTVKQIKEDNDPYYWFMWEFGHNNLFTRRFERKPFMVPAIEMSRADALAAMEKSIARAIRRVEAKAKK